MIFDIPSFINEESSRTYFALLILNNEAKTPHKFLLPVLISSSISVRTQKRWFKEVDSFSWQQSCLALVLAVFSVISMADSKTPSLSEGKVQLNIVFTEPKVHIVYTEKPEGQVPEEYNIKTLAAVMGSEEAARESLLNHYKHVLYGFSAKLTPDQVEELPNQPGVIEVVPQLSDQPHGPR